MRLPAIAKISLQNVLLGIGLVGLGSAVLVLPLYPDVFQHWFYLIVGLAPLPFLKQKDRLKYLSFAFIIGALIGLLTLISNGHSCGNESRYCVDGAPSLFIPGSIVHFILLLIGLFLMRRITGPTKK